MNISIYGSVLILYVVPASVSEATPSYKFKTEDLNFALTTGNFENCHLLKRRHCYHFENQLPDKKAASSLSRSQNRHLKTGDTL
jgi:hypothetical protein